MKLKDVWAQLMEDAKYAAAYEERAPDFEIARAIVQRRTELDWGQEVLAYKAHLMQSYIMNLEDANGNPPLVMLKRVANALGCTLHVTFEKKVK